MRKLLFLSVIIILGIFQAGPLSYFRIFQVKPDLLLVSVIIAGLYCRPVAQAIGFSIVAGLLKDTFSANNFGPSLVLFPVWCLLSINLSRKISFDTDLIRVGFVLIVVILNDVIGRLIFLPAGNFIPYGIFSKIVFLSAGYTAFVSVLLFRMLAPIFP